MDERSRQQEHGAYTFGEFSLDVAERTFTRRGQRIHLAPKTYDVLTLLVMRANRLVTKCELLECIWPGVFVEESILTVHVAQLRKALGEIKGAYRYIETVSGTGYRFVEPVGRGNACGSGRQPPPQYGEMELQLT